MEKQGKQRHKLYQGTDGETGKNRETKKLYQGTDGETGKTEK